MNRRDKYQRNVYEYWVDISTTGEHEREEGEEVVKNTGIDGEAEDFSLGGIEPGKPLLPDAIASDDDESDDSDRESSDFSPAKARGKAPKRHGKGKGRKEKKNELEEERLLEAREPVQRHHTLNTHLFHIHGRV